MSAPVDANELPYHAGGVIRKRLMIQLEALTYDFDDVSDRGRRVAREAAGVLKELDVLAVAVNAHQGVPGGETKPTWLLPFYGPSGDPQDWLPAKQWIAARKNAACEIAHLRKLNSGVLSCPAGLYVCTKCWKVSPIPVVTFCSCVNPRLVTITREELEVRS